MANTQDKQTIEPREVIYVVRHSGIQSPNKDFGIDGIATEGDIYTQSQLESADINLARMILLGAIEEPSRAEEHAYNAAIKLAQREADIANGLIDEAQEQLVALGIDSEKESAEKQALLDQLAAQDEKMNAMETQMRELRQLIISGNAQKAKSEKKVVSPQPDKVTSPNPGATSNPELQAQNISGNQSNEVVSNQVDQSNAGDGTTATVTTD